MHALVSAQSGEDAASVTQLQQPAFPVRVEEGVCQVVPIILRDFKGLAVDALVEFLEGRSLEMKPAGEQWAWPDTNRVNQSAC